MSSQQSLAHSLIIISGWCVGLAGCVCVTTPLRGDQQYGFWYLRLAISFRTDTVLKTVIRKPYKT